MYEALAAENASLRARLSEVEAERDAYEQQNSELFVLQQVISTINSSLEIDDILSMVLRGIREALRFNRVVLFDVADGRVARRLETDAEGMVIAAPEPEDFNAASPLFTSMATKKTDFLLGFADDEEVPLRDVRGTFCMLPLISRDTVRGILYVDDSPSSEINDATLRMLLDFASQAAIAIENARLFSEATRLLEETQRLALTDPLTSLYNRRGLSEMLERELSNAERQGLPLAFIVLDLDDLKRINDSSGHAAGDWALKNFADLLRATARKGDVTARYAGDEFVVLMPHTDREQAEIGVERIFRTLKREGVKCSVGVALFPYDGADGAALFFAADEALYAAKQAGKNRWVFYDRGVENPTTNVAGMTGDPHADGMNSLIVSTIEISEPAGVGFDDI